MKQIGKWFQGYEWQVWAVYFGIAFVVMLPLLLPGFVLTLDMVWTPHIPMPTDIDNSYLFFALLHWLNIVVPADILQKIVLTAIVVVAGVGMHRLVRGVFVFSKAGFAPTYIAGLFYAVNPFVYERFMAGQYLVLGGYSLLPWLVWYLWRWGQRPDFKATLRLVAVGVAISITSIHTAGLAGVLCAVAGVFWLSNHWNERQLLRTGAGYALLGIGLFALGSIYWLWPLIRGEGALLGQVTSFDDRDVHAFATLGATWIEKIGNVLQLQGFWQEGTGLFNLPQTSVAGWGIIMCIWWIAVGWGLVYLWRHRRRQAVFWALLLSLSLWLATGVSQEWLAAHVPLWRGYREPQKFVALVALCYALLGSMGIAAMAEKWPRARSFLVVGGFTVPLLLSAPMLWGFGGQLQARQYPDDWYRANTFLAHDTAQFQTLFLPWHLYMFTGFADRVIANPAPQFFASPIISSHNPEFGNLPTPSQFRIQRTLEAGVFPDAAARTDIGTRLAPFGIKYIIMAKEFDYQDYQYLDAQADLRVVQDTPLLKIYQNKAFTGEKP